MQDITAADRADIVVGKPLGFAVYGADKTLLLASGHLVPNEFVRQGLLRSGKFRSANVDRCDTPTALVRALSPGWHKLMTDYSQLFRRARTGFRMIRADSKTEGTSYCLGASDNGALIMSAPVGSEGQSIDIVANETWTFRAFYAESALRFKARVAGVVCDPFPHLYLHPPEDVELHNVRKWPRATVCLPPSRVGDPPRLIVDLCVGGARVAVDSRGALTKGQNILLHSTFKMLGGEQSFSIDAEVLNAYGHSDAGNPDISFYGVRFLQPSQREMLVIHAFVQEQLYLELDRVRQVLITPTAH